MSLTISNLFANQTPAQWLAILLSSAAAANPPLPVTSWFSGDPLRTTLQILSVQLAHEDAQIAIQAQGGFLDFAASGTTTLTDINGNTTILAVSPDPSIAGQNPNANPTWLDELASSVYNVSRVKAFAASGQLYLSNTTGGSLGTFQPGTLHVQNTVTGATFTYSGVGAFTFSPSAVLGTSVTAATAASPPVITTSAGHGLTIGQTAVVAFTNVGVIANGVYAVFVIDATHVSVTGQIGTGSYSGTAGRMYATTPLQFSADLVGTGSNSPPNEIITFTTAAPGGYVNNALATLAGGNYQSNTSLAALCRAYLGALSLAGASGAYIYYALNTSNIVGGLPVNVTGTNPSGIILANPLPANITLDGGPITQAVTNINTTTGQVTTNVRNAGGAVAGCIGNIITGATTASPIVITTGAPHNLVTGDFAQVNLVQGLSGANGVWQVTKIDATHVSLNGSTGAGAYTPGTGQISGGDLYAVSSVLQTYATPNGTTQITQSATPVTVNVAATVYVPKAFVSQYSAAWPTALSAYFSALPIGGLNVDNTVNVLPLGAIEGLLFAVGSSAGSIYTLSVNAVTLNTVAADVNLGTSGVAVLGTTNITVVGV